jgi:hypothetical protein
MCLTPKTQIQNIDFCLIKVRHGPHPINTNSKHRILFDRDKAYASRLTTRLRRNYDLFKKGEASASP